MRFAILAAGDGWHVRDLQRAARALGHQAVALDFRRVSAGIATGSCDAPTRRDGDAETEGRSVVAASPRRRVAVALEELAGFDGVLVRTMPPGSLEQVIFRMDVLHRLQAAGVPVLNPARVVETCVDKYLAAARLEEAGLRVPPTVACQHADAALDAFHALGGDVVVKPLFGSEGRGMMRLADPDLAWRTFRTLERLDNVLYVQRYIEHPGWDLRVFVLDGRAVATMRRCAAGGWRTNVAQGGRAETVQLTAEPEALALGAAAAVGAPVAGVDLLPGPAGEWYVLEVNAVPGWRALAPLTGIDIPVLMLRFLADSFRRGQGSEDEGVRGQGSGVRDKKAEGGRPKAPASACLPPSAFCLPPSSLTPDPSPLTSSLAPLPTGLCAQVACVWEATARKPGNVHRCLDFDDAHYVDFLLSAAAIARVMETAAQRGVGQTILEAVRATRRVVNTNTNLGIVLLFAPLAAVPAGEALRPGSARVLGRLDVADARAVYQAIRLAAPSGLGRVPEQDITAEPTQTLKQVMALAADRDLVACQYADGFHEVFDEGVPALSRALGRVSFLEDAVIACHLHLMACRPDSLIARKRGPAEAGEAARRARQVLDAGWPGASAGRAALDDLDGWLRGAGHARNPGTTADLVAACLFVALREGIMTLPSRLPWSAALVAPPA